VDILVPAIGELMEGSVREEGAGLNDAEREHGKGALREEKKLDTGGSSQRQNRFSFSLAGV